MKLDALLASLPPVEKFGPLFLALLVLIKAYLFDGEFTQPAIVLLVFLFLLRFRKRMNLAHDTIQQPSAESQIESVKVRYELTSNGFLPETVLNKLPTQFAVWEDLVASLPRLHTEGGVREAISTLPLLDCSQLRSTEEIRRAYIVVGMVVHSYLNNSEDRHVQGVRRIPRNIGSPWRNVCHRLGLPEVLCAIGLDGWNWRQIDPARGMVLDNLRCVSTMTGTLSEEYFHMIPCAIHCAFAKKELMARLYLIPYFQAKSLQAELTNVLSDLISALDDTLAILKEIPTRIDKDVFYNDYRPLLAGWYPDGVVIDVGGGLEHMVKWKGPSAGQSTVFLILDTLLGISHGPSMEEFQKEMRQYMPPHHSMYARDMVARVAIVGDLQKYARKNPRFAGQVKQSIERLARIRQLHLRIASDYLQSTSTGTGSSTFRSMLASGAEATVVRLSETEKSK